MAKYYSDPAANYPIDNIFGVNNPENYECHVKRYDSRLALLEVYTRKLDQSSEEDIFLSFVFNAVDYFEGTMIWIGANFRVGSPEECVQIARKMPNRGDAAERSILDFYDLFVVETPQLQIKILAGSGGLVTVKE